MKVCRGCGKTLPLADFHREPRVSDGRRAKCKHCASQRRRRWSEANAQHVKAYNKEDAQRRKAYQREWRRNNTERLRENRSRKEATDYLTQWRRAQ